MSKTFDQGRQEVAGLCKYFATNQEAFAVPGIKEAPIRQSLIDPFFEALGWNVRNSPPVAPHLREVIPEDTLDVEGSQRVPDYTFRVGTTPRFLVEAKKCGTNISADLQAAYQLRRYGWSANVPLSILTDFEELAVYDCALRPRPTDKASQARIMYFRFDEYVDRWRELWDVFSHEAMWSGAFDQYAVSKRKRGTSEVDTEFLKDIAGWRETLARGIALRNTNISSDDLNAAVQLTIDRVVFLRMAEDRGLEPYEQLLKLCQQPDIYARFLRHVCRRADEKYNSGLFHFDKGLGVSEPPDRLTPHLSVDDKVIKPIIQSLYFAHGSPYDFRVLPVEILGTVYERFLGKVIRLTAGHQAKIEEKSEVRRAGGVYYTPAYIVGYIVTHTAGRQIEGKSPAQLAGRNGKPPLRVLDLACGSGSFLLGAYQCLLDHCLKWYVEHNPRSHKREVYRALRHGEWRLTIAKRKRILTTHIFGVDIDPQAVEVTKLSLLLKALEGEDDSTLSMQLRLFNDRALPNLAENIKCGNSLIEPEFYADRSRDLLDPEKRKKINAFDWQAEFRQVLESGGFDVVIGNPPYVNARTLFQEQGKETKQFFARRYVTARRGYDLYVLFVEKSLELLRKDGRCGMIVPNKIATLDYAEACRAILLEQTTIERITDVSGLRVFPTAGVYPYIMVWKKTPPRANHFISVLHARHEPDLLSTQHAKQVKQRGLTAAGGIAIHGTLDVESRVATQPLARRARLHSGTTGFAAKQMADSLCEKTGIRTRQYFEFVVSGNIDRYSIKLGNVRFMNRQFTRPVLPADRPHLTENKRTLFGGRKLVVAGMTKRLEVALDDVGGLALGVSVYAATDMSDHPLYLLGLLNSKLLSHLFRIRFQAKHLAGGFLAINKGQLARLPIRVIDFAVADDKKKHDKIATLTERMTILTGQRGEAVSERVEGILERQIASTDAEVDRVVYELYGLTDDEIRSVEESTAAVGK